MQDEGAALLQYARLERAALETIAARMAAEQKGELFVGIYKHGITPSSVKAEKRLVSQEQADHIVGRVSGVKLGDTKLQAAEKAVQTMRDAGFPASAIRKAERMVADYKSRGGK